MDVERLMQDLSVEQLQNIHSNLSLEMEEKKEELRQMVGRRYRDVLDASSAVRRVTQIADTFAANVHQLRVAGAERCDQQRDAVSSSLFARLSALVKLYHLIGTMDPLSDAFVLVVVGNMHLCLSTKSSSLKQFGAFMRMMSPRLIRMKLKLEHEFISGLSTLDDPSEVTNQLAAIAILKKHSLEELLDIFLQQKLAVKQSASQGSQSLIDIICRIRRTMDCVQSVFVDGQLAATLRIFRNRNWMSKPLTDYISNEPLSFAMCLQAEIEAANEQNASLQIEALGYEVLTAKCNSFLESVCNESQGLVKQKTEFFESSEALIHFLNVLLDAFRENWPVIGESVIVYHKFFGSSLIDKFQALINTELANLERGLLAKFGATECHPSVLFKKRVPKFDALLATGVSKQLVELVKDFDDGLKKVFENVKTYESIGKEEAIAELRAQFAVALIDMLSRMCGTCDDVVKVDSSVTESTGLAERALAMARLYLAILQSRSSVISMCLSKNNEQVSQCANMLRNSSEKCFCKFLDEAMVTCAKEVEIERLTMLPTDPFISLSYVQEFEKMDLPEVGIVEVPLQISRLLYGFLHAVCLKICDHSIGHLCTRAIRSHVGESVRDRLADVYERAVREHEQITSRLALQYVFDVRVLNSMFPAERLRNLITLIESRIDPFDVTLLAGPIAKNARIAAQRYSMVFGHLLVDVPSTKESSLSESYTAVVDTVPRGSEAKMRSISSAANMQARKKAPSNVQAAGVRNAPSLSSFYKLSASWFGN
ncbi:unnamed protein product [Toxocara canis]|uniref:Conserved oligomeric Golgi complex subunit 1 n=1 Tax=Toxocara canis TaxID=6265 RepID=A0A183UAK0_TOXCA|nr:unnamed protein product [Toxocara canis]